jgi:hypothetical protein
VSQRFLARSEVARRGSKKTSRPEHDLQDFVFAGDFQIQTVKATPGL